MIFKTTKFIEKGSRFPYSLPRQNGKTKCSQFRMGEVEKGQAKINSGTAEQKILRP